MHIQYKGEVVQRLVKLVLLLYCVEWLTLRLLFQYDSVSGFYVFRAERFPFWSDKLEWIKNAVFQCKTLFVSWKPIKGHVATCHRDAQGVSRSQSESQSWVCMSVGETVVGFRSGVGWRRDAETGSDSRYHQLQTSPVIPQRGGPVLYQRPWNSAEKFQLLKGLFDIFMKRLV